MDVPKKCINCMHHKVAEHGTDYCDYVEHWNGYAMSDEEYELLKIEHEICCTGNCFCCDIFGNCKRLSAESDERFPGED
ncbi:MAG: hypothetical protein ACRDBO_00090 [Lachnospiraceae bacterium]